MCLGAGSNRRPLPLQGNALPTELPKQCVTLYLVIDIFQPVDNLWLIARDRDRALRSAGQQYW
jgi:hypothetical protein